MVIPTFNEAMTAVQGGNPNPLEIFVYEYEPAKYFNSPWREHLADLIAFLQEQDNTKKPIYTT